MSARMPRTMTESNKNSVDVHDWLEQINGSIGVAELGSSPLATVCSSAVDPLEIAVALEVAGISHAVATNRYNRADVFALARTLWSRVPHRPVTAKPAKLPRAGDWRDLGRGVLYILPAVMLLALTKALDVELANWVLPVAISWGWGLGQVAAFAGYTIQGAGMPYEAIIMVRVLAAAAVSTWIVSTLATMVSGGGGADVGATTALVTYMVASAILLVRAEEGWLAVLLLPGALASAYVLARSNGSVFSRSAAVVVIGGSFFAVLCRASRQLRLRNPGSGRFVVEDALVASKHLLHGVICGVAVSLIVIQRGHPSAANRFGHLLLPVPLLASLGAMEWQLHTFRARMARLLNSLGSIKQFPRLARRVFYRSFVICVLAIVTPAIGVMVAIGRHGGDISVEALTVQCALGAVYFVDLIMVLLDRLDLALRSWLSGIVAALIAGWALLAVTGRHLNSVVYPSATVLVVVVLGSLLFYSREVVSAAMTH
jgi:hypothetical protein